MSPTLAKPHDRLRWLIALALVIALAALLFGRSMQRQMILCTVVHSEWADANTVQELIETTPDRAAMILRLWQTRKISHRLLVVEYLKAAALSQPGLCRQLRPLLLEAALDADMDTREQALATLEIEKDPSLPDLARLQLRDFDTYVRLLGIQYLRKVGNRQLVPELLGLLADPDPRVIATADSLLRAWTGSDFGLRIKMVIPEAPEDSNVALEPANAEILRQAVLKWQDWVARQPNQLPGSECGFPATAELRLAFDVPVISTWRIWQVIA